MKTKNLLVLLVLLGITWTRVSAYDFQGSDGAGGSLYYNIISETDKTVSVGYNNDKDYFVGYGNKSFPETVTYDGKTYTIVRIGCLGGFDLTYDVPSMTTAIIPKTVTTISNYAFYNYENLTNLTIKGNSLTTIGINAFSGCNLSSFLLPSSVTSIGDYAFYDCSNLSSFTIFAPTAPSLGGSHVFHNIPANSILYYPMGSDYSAWEKYFSKTIPVYSGTCGNELTWVYAPENHKLFIYGTGEMTDFSSYTETPWHQYIKNPASDSPYYYAVEVEIAEGVTHIGNYAFSCSGNSAVSYVHIPSTMKSIGNYAFNNNTDLTINSNATIAPTLGANVFPDYSNATSLIYPVGADYSAWSEYIDISNEFQKEISGTFTGPFSHYFTWKLNIISGILTISGSGDMPDWTSSSFAPWFTYRKFITSVEISEGINNIGAYAFKNCKWLSTIKMSENLSEIGQYALGYCFNLVNVELPQSLTEINSSAFDNCIKLSRLVIPEGVTYIGSRAFNGCNELKYIELPRTLSTMEKGAFTYVYELDTVVCHSEVLELSRSYSYFSNLPSNATLYYPAGCDYSTWERYFSNMIPIAEEISINISSTNNWSTCVIPFVTELPEGMRAFTSTGIEKDKLLLEEVVSLNSYTPYILYAENGFIGSLTGKMDVANYHETVTDGLLNGAITTQQISTGYVLQNQGGGSMFHNVNGKTFTIPAGKCWLDEILPGVATVRVSFGGTTNIEGTETEESKGEDTIYDLSGRPVDNPQKGKIYIINGKKVLKL